MKEWNGGATAPQWRACALSLAVVAMGGCAGLGGDLGQSAQSVAAGDYSIWPSGGTPAVPADSDSMPTEVGVKFRVDADGVIKSIRFYKGSGNTGTHTGHLWSRAGALLGSVTFTGESASGWQTATFATPVAVAANTTYVASYHTDVGHYAVNTAYFTSDGVDLSPVHALRSGVDGPNGVYQYGAAAFPTLGDHDTNYWVDVIYSPGAPVDASVGGDTGVGGDAGAPAETGVGGDAGLDASPDAGTDAAADSGAPADSATDAGMDGGAIDGGATPGPRRWSDPATWGGVVPSATTVANITAPVLLDVDTRVAGVTVQDGGELVFDPSVAHTLESTGNVVVLGKLTMHPATPAVVQTLRFVNVDESRFQGGGMVVLDTDVGLWVMEDGRLDLVGSPRTGWTRLAGGIAAGATSATLQTAPTGWQAGDEIVIAPTEPPTAGDPSVTGFDAATIRTVSGASLAWSTGTARPHPQVNGAWTAEVLNLTRNVRIEGTPGHRTHLFVHAMQPQTVSYAQLRYVGPRQPDGTGYTQSVLGRYGVHFHMADDASRGSRVVGTVVRDAGAHAFVPHESHGIYFYDTVAYNTYDEAYWWDMAPDTRTPGPETDDTVYDHCAAAWIHTDPPFRGYRNTGFALLQGLRNVVRDSVAVGVEGTTDAAGFQWPESDGDHGHGVWNFSRGNVTHNNAIHGIFSWQNDSQPHVIANFVSYYNGAYGLDHGAYSNIYHYENGVLYGNAAGALNLQGVSSDTARTRFDNVTFDGAGVSTDLVSSFDHQFDGTVYPTVFSNPTFRGARNAFHFGIGGAGQPDGIDVLYPTLGTTADVVFDADAPAASVVRIQYDASRATRITPAGRTTIVPFAAASDTSPPQVAFLAPTGGTRVAGSVAVAVQAYDNVGVARVELSVDGALRATSAAAPFAFTLDATALSAGAHTLQLQAYDAAGNANGSEQVTVFAGP